MGIREQIISFLGAASAAEVAQRINEAYEQGFYDGNDDPAQGDFQKGGLGYKRLSDSYIREGKVEYNRAIETAWALWLKSPIAKRVLAMKRDHIIGHSADPDSNDEDLMPILKAFWQTNKLDKRASEFTIQLFGFGEQCIPAFVREADGRVLIGYIDPANIEKVIKHPDNALEDWAIVAQKYLAGGYTSEKLIYRIIREAEDGSAYEGKLINAQQAQLEEWELQLLKEYSHEEYDGSCFYVKVNSVSNQSRGMSDLLQVGDWIEQADEVLFSLADRENFAGYFAFDVTLASATRERVKERAKELRNNPPKKGTVNVHNDSETWQMWSPELGQTGSIESFRAILGLILGGIGFPVHWYGFGDDANRATATVQADPTSKSLEHDQAIVQEFFLSMLQYVQDQADIAGIYSPPEEEVEIMLSMPEISAKDLTRTTASMQGLVTGLMNAEDSGWITKETAARAFAKLMAEFDVQYDVIEEIEEVEKQKEEQQLNDFSRQNGQLNFLLQQQQDEEDYFGNYGGNSG